MSLQSIEGITHNTSIVSIILPKLPKQKNCTEIKQKITYCREVIKNFKEDFELYLYKYFGDKNYFLVGNNEKFQYFWISETCK